MTAGKVTGMITLALGTIALLGYAFDVMNYYQPATEAAAEHGSIRSYVDKENAGVRAWSELDSIKSQIEIAELKITRITDRADAERRPLTAGEAQEVASLRAEVNALNSRRNAILARQK